MNTHLEYLKEIRYRPARCCKNCDYFREVHENITTQYCWLHDNPIQPTAICKNFIKKSIPKGVKELL